MKPLVVASNMLNERDQLPGWLEFVNKIADGGILVVDGKSIDGTQELLRDNGAIVIEDEIIQREGYGPARNHLRAETKKYFRDAHWMMYLDADERIMEDEFHQLRWLKDYLIEDFDVIALPRIDWKNAGMTEMAKDWRVYPDWQARMTRLDSPLFYVRRLHEQLSNFRRIHTNLSTPKINHFHRTAGQEKRDFVGKLCAKLHNEDTEWGHTYPQHHKEAHYLELYEKEGL